MPIEYSPAQKKAIEHRGSDLLVSAAAGSGKTAVLTARVLSLIAQGEKLDSMLIVTFTKAAAAQMRQRIAAAIEESELPDKASLMQDVSRAQISTIDSFCVSFLRENFTAAGLDPMFTVIDDNRAERLKLQAMEDTFESFFETYGDDGYELLTQLGGIDRAKELVLRLNTFASAQRDPMGWKKACLLEYEKSCENIDASKWALQVMKKAKSLLEISRNRLIDALELSKADAFAGDFVSVLESDIAQVDDLLSLSKLSYARFSNAKASFLRWPSNKNTRNAAAKDIIKNYRDEAKKLISQALLIPPADVAQKNCAAMYGALSALVMLSNNFEQSYSSYKADDNCLDFADLEHKTYEALSDPAVSETAKNRYHHIFVDEYQDVNELQDAIFSKLSNGQNLFMVGDVKQSIYAFRMAEPDLFVQKYLRFEKGEGGHKIDLNANYRSDTNVLSCVNNVFKKSMTMGMGGVDYDENAMLYPGRSEKGVPVIVRIADRRSTLLESESELTLEELKVNALEAQIVKDEILSQMGSFITENGITRPVHYCDICILMRSGTFTKALTDALKAADIPYRTDTVSGYYELEEVKTLLNLLALIDNFHQDLPLIGAMTAPYGKFTAAELAHIRSSFPEKDTHFYKAVEKYAQVGDSLSVRINEFMKNISAWRRLGRTMPPDALIHSVLDDTGYYDFLGGLPSGAIRQANIRMLISKAGAYDTLSSFMSGIELMKLVSTEKVQESSGDEGGNCVRIMTIHKSKGLEYPIVILTGLCKSFYLRDTSDRLIIHKHAGFGINFIDTRLKYTQDTLSHLAVANRILQDSLSEELRLLYVAMTRAKNRLIMTGAYQNIEKHLSQWCDSARSNDFTLARSYADFVIPALLLHKDSEELRQLCGFSDPCDAADSMFDVKIIKNREPDDISEDPDAIFSPDMRTKDMWVQKRLSWVYEAPDGDGLNKSGVTALSREDKQEGIPVPAFIDPTGVQAAARRGTAIHAVMSCLDKASLKGLNFYQTEDNIEAQLKGLIKSGALSLAEAGAISAKKLAAFFTCELGKDALSSGDILCEQPFNILFSNKELGADENDSDSTMLQGVIDMCFLKDGTWVIVDFKTGFVSNDKAKERYSAQVGIYAKAIKRLTGKNACGYIYLLDRSISIPVI